MIFLLVMALSVPNPDLTPGLTRQLPKAVVCSTKWGLDRRFVSTAMKKHVASAYGVPWEKRAFYEFDHLIPRSIGGADDVLNLWPQPISEARIKDRREVQLNKDVCAGRITLEAAQQEMKRWGRP